MIPGLHLRRRVLKRSGIRLAPRTEDAEGRRLFFRDGTSIEIATVIWAVGYRDDTSWLDVPAAIGADEGFEEVRGVSPVPGLYHIGRSWQNNRASALLCGIDGDARDIIGRCVRWLGE